MVMRSSKGKPELSFLAKMVRRTLGTGKKRVSLCKTDQKSSPASPQHVKRGITVGFQATLLKLFESSVALNSALPQGLPVYKLALYWDGLPHVVLVLP